MLVCTRVEKFIDFFNIFSTKIVNSILNYIFIHRKRDKERYRKRQS